MKKILIFTVLFLVPIWASDYNEEQLAELKARALQEAKILMMQEIVNITKDIKLFITLFFDCNNI